MLPPAPSVVVGATVEKRFPGYGIHRGTIAEINDRQVVVHWAATDERTTLSLKEAAKRVVASPMADEEEDDAPTTALIAAGTRIHAKTTPAKRPRISDTASIQPVWKIDV